MSKKTKACKHCGEEILAVAKICKHCGQRVAGLTKPAQYFIIIIFIIAIANAFLDKKPLQQNQTTQSEIQKPKPNIDKYRVYDVKVDNTGAYSVVWRIRGMVENLDRVPVKGYVNIKLLNKNGDYLRSFSALVNKGEELAPFQSGFFEYSTDPEEFEGYTDIKIIFKGSKK